MQETKDNTDTEIAYRLDPFPSEEELAPLWRAAWGDDWGGDLAFILTRSLTHACAYAGTRMVGYVNVAWDGGVHAFLLDTTVDPEFQRRGIAKELVRQVADAARERGAHWLHVDYEEKLDGFYKACGFRPTAAGLIRLA
ncbi:GNAT family N-acetyltransferase [Devosia insulae DS-56]|uniref:GNAT family N-acetyltransferase n=1 Tax=Devosia insulae DS-56 TaxID=1116389 RepID=A0A1E5XP83_9HYPH|nr:GNAT family N-acetyltransferase [Devosia insulae]OEO30403.1 GNAT family N-acetyltransferase [Devosia insulae DS-56]